MPKPILSIDIDGTLADSHARWLELVKDRYGIRAQKKDLIIYDFWEILGLENEEVCLDIFREAWKNYKDIEPLSDDVADVVGKLRHTYDICINTACVGKQEEVKSWLNYNNIEYDLFHFCKTREEKFEVRPALHIDDSGEIAERFALNGNNTILISQPWNKSLHKKLGVYSNITIASKWSEIAAIAFKRNFE